MHVIFLETVEVCFHEKNKSYSLNPSTVSGFRFRVFRIRGSGQISLFSGAYSPICSLHLQNLLNRIFFESIDMFFHGKNKMATCNSTKIFENRVVEKRSWKGFCIFFQIRRQFPDSVSWSSRMSGTNISILKNLSFAQKDFWKLFWNSGKEWALRHLIF